MLLSEKMEMKETPEVIKEVSEMCSLSEFFEARGEAKGMTAGLTAGRSEGKADMQKLVSAMNEHGEAEKIPEVFADDSLLAEYCQKYGI